MPKKPERILPFRDQASDSRGLEGVLNLGPKSSAWLRDAGVDSLPKIRKLGAIETCRRLRERGHPASVLMAYALEGAITGCHWNEIPWETKQSLKAEFAEMKKTDKAMGRRPPH